MMTRVGDVEPVLGIDTQSFGAVELAIAIAATPHDANPNRPFRSELLHALGQAVFAHENVPA